MSREERCLWVVMGMRQFETRQGGRALAVRGQRGMRVREWMRLRRLRMILKGSSPHSGRLDSESGGHGCGDRDCLPGRDTRWATLMTAIPRVGNTEEGGIIQSNNRLDEWRSTSSYQRTIMGEILWVCK